ncbi:energy-coupling factor ABC transporter substrate-binding protein [Clostridium tarantellae]|uniref:Cobalt transport protein CbiN n=1 Tax=Clostridium tarantellae TaxID=39493 RepID=A0A6I1MIH2_9CLOT|nr:energy-coupling factor ABC transporter substrate-binding protein [Clostridium tarantellae]
MKKNLLFILICVVLIVSPFIISKNGAFEGADDQAENLITELNSDYEPWFESLWEPPSGEVESFLFSLQAAIGSGFIGYYVGKKKNDKRDNTICSK